MTVCLPEVRKRFADDLYATQTTGIEIVEVDELYAKCMLHLAAKHKNAMGAVMGGVLYTLADFAFAVAANYDTLTTVSISGDIKFLSASKSDVLYAVARCVKNGKANCFFDVDIVDGDDKLIAKASIVGAKINAK